MYDLVVIGGGAGGLSVARKAAGVGARVAVIERLCLGGQRARTAAVPGKALLRAAQAVQDVRRAPIFGIQAGPPTVDFRAVLDRISHLVAHETEAARSALVTSGVELFQGTAAFEAYDTVVIDGQTSLNARRFVIATGSRPATPAIEGLDRAGYRDHGSIWSLSSLPESLIVIGDGPNALEFAQAFARLGSRVTVLSGASRLLSNEDPAVSERIRTALTAEGLTIRTGLEFQKVVRRDGRIVVTVREAGQTEFSEVDAADVMVSGGRLANVGELNLEAVDVDANPIDGIPVDAYLRTRAPNIYALGDVIGRHLWAHAAEREAEVVFQNAVLRMPRKIDYRAVPRVVYTDPEIAAVGLTEVSDAEEPTEARTWCVELAELDRARIDGATQGFAKAITDRTGRILGATIMAPNAPSLITEFVLAMDQGLTLADLAGSIHPDPSYASLVARLGERYRGDHDRQGVVNRLARWYHRQQATGAGPVA